MNKDILPFENDNSQLPQLDSSSDLETVLEAWHGATVRLERTHEALRSEVERLSNELEKKNRELARKNRLADLGQMASHVAHEVRNNLVPVTLYLSLLRRRLVNDLGSLDVLEKVEAGFLSLDATVNDLLHFTSEREPQLETVDVRRLVDEVITSVAPQLVAQEIETSVDIPIIVSITADRMMLRRAMLNLVLNALDAMPAGGELVVTGHLTASGLDLEIADSGAGLKEDCRPRIFEPFFTTKSTGTGLGLAIVYRVAEVHQGEVIATNCPEGGAAFTLRIPRKVKQTVRPELMERAA